MTYSDLLLTLALQLCCFLPFLILACILCRAQKFRYIVAALTVMTVDFLLVTAPIKIPILRFKGQHWNWSGKGAEILFAILIFGLFPRIRKNCGLQWKQTIGSKAKSIFILSVLILGGLFIGVMNPHETFKLQAFLFQLFMPSLSEEFLYRGILFFLFLKAFRMTRKGRVASALLVTMWFGIIHAALIHNGSVHFSIIVFAVSGIIGGLLMILRLVSGSLVLPVAGHSIYNLCIQTVAVLR